LDLPGATADVALLAFARACGGGLSHVAGQWVVGSLVGGGDVAVCRPWGSSGSLVTSTGEAAGHSLVSGVPVYLTAVQGDASQIEAVQRELSDIAAMPPFVYGVSVSCYSVTAAFAGGLQAKGWSWSAVDWASVSVSVTSDVVRSDWFFLAVERNEVVWKDVTSFRATSQVLAQSGWVSGSTSWDSAGTELSLTLTPTSPGSVLLSFSAVEPHGVFTSDTHSLTSTSVRSHLALGQPEVVAVSEVRHTGGTVGWPRVVDLQPAYAYHVWVVVAELR
jgi:hypothetical protein